MNTLYNTHTHFQTTDALSIFHLAGALGRPVWGFIPIPAEWRYLQAGTSSPWYPSARLFRQSVRGEWGSVIQSISDELGYLSARSNQDS